MSQRSTGSQYDRKQVEGNGEQRRQQNRQSNAAGGQQGEAGGTSNRVGNANESGSMGSTRRDDAPRKPQR